MRSLLCASAVALILAASAAQAWGPASHYWFTCQAMHGEGKSCVETHDDLISGTELPDAFIFGDFTTGATPGQLPCAGLGALHNPFYAGVMVQLAVNDSMADPAGTCYNITTGDYKEGFTAATCFNAYEFGMGFGAHVVADVAGFLFPDAYLGNGYKAPNVEGHATDKNWVSIWPFMTAVDAHVLGKQFASGTKCPKNVLKLGGNATAFLTRANAKLIDLYPQALYPPAGAAQIAECAIQWHRVISNECAKAQAMPESSYKFEMVYNDVYGATTQHEAKSHFDMAQKCAIKGIKKWKAAILAADATALSATYVVVDAFYDWFGTGECAPMNITMPPQQLGAPEVEQGNDLEVVKEIVDRVAQGNLRKNPHLGSPLHNHYLHKMGFVHNEKHQWNQ